MREGWKEVAIGDLGKVITGKTPPTSDRTYFDGNELFVSPKDLDFNTKYIYNTQTSISDKALKKFKNQVLPKDAIMYTSLSYGFGKIGIASKPCLTNQQINSIIVNSNYDHLFVYYLLVNSKDYLLAFNSGIVTPIIPKSAFEKIKVFVPERIETQRKIASILSAYDDLIENNLKRIKILEEMAQQTYEEWFVRMKFPGYENVVVDDETGLPEGWERVKLGELGEYLNGFAFKPSDFEEKGFPIIKIKEMKSGLSSDTPRNSGQRVSEKYFVEPGDILFSWSATLDVVIWANERGFVNQHLFKVTPFEKYSKAFVFYSIKDSLKIFDGLTTGATMKHIKRKELDFVEINTPPKSIMDKFKKNVDPILDIILNLNNQNQRLRESRDILLPRLMMGILEV